MTAATLSRSTVSLRPKSHQLALQKAKSLSRSVLFGVHEAERAVIADAGRRRAAEKDGKEAQVAKLREKAAACMEVVKSSEECVGHVREMLRQLGQCLRQLQCTRYAQFAELKVCEHRLRLRSAGPPEELVKDKAQKALYNQQLFINGARDELLSLEREVKKALEIIGELKSDLSADAAGQRHQAENCRASVALVQNAISVAQIEDKLEREGAHGNVNQEVLDRARALLDEASRLAERCGEAVYRTGDQCARAKARAEECLAQRTLESENAAKELRKQAAEVDYTIDAAERSLEKSCKRLQGREEVSRAAHLDRTHFALQQLRNTRQQIKVEIQRKSKMQSIDESCRKVTTQSASAEDLFASGNRRMPMSRPATASGGGLRSSASAWSLAAGPDPASELTVTRGLPQLTSLDRTPCLSVAVEGADSMASTAATAIPRPQSACNFGGMRAKPKLAGS